MVKKLFDDIEDFQFDVSTGFFEKTVNIPIDKIGNSSITVVAINNKGAELEAKVNINITLPPEVILIKIKASPNPVILFKLPPGSDPNKVNAYETRSLSVGGFYSDGIERELTESSETQYISGDENIATVTPKRKVVAQRAGITNITVSNGSQQAVIKVLVKDKK